MTNLLIACGVLLLVFPFTLTGQKSGLSVSAGMATFRMDDMKYYQEYLLNSYPVEGRTISSFPPYFAGSFSYIRQLYPHIRAGAVYGYSSTGAKSDYTDFSGNIHTTLLASSHRIGGSVAYEIIGSERISLFLSGEVSLNISTLTISTSIYVLGLSNGVTSKYRAYGPSGLPKIEFHYRFKEYSIGLDGGFLVDFPGKLTDITFENPLTDPDNANRILTTDWTGWQANLKFIVWLK